MRSSKYSVECRAVEWLWKLEFIALANRQLTQLGHEVIVAHIKAVGPAQKSRFLRSDSLRLYSEVEVTTVPDLAIQPD